MKGFFRGFKEGMHLFGNKVVVIINTFLLLLVYVIAVGITAIIARIVRKKFLQANLEKTKTYWVPVPPKTKKLEEHYRQF